MYSKCVNATLVVTKLMAIELHEIALNINVGLEGNAEEEATGIVGCMVSTFPCTKFQKKCLKKLHHEK